MKIDLTTEEEEILKGIDFEALHQRDRTDYLRNSALVLKLTKSLLVRKAIPEHRLKYFTSPEYNAGGRGKSRKQGFEGNGNHGDEIILHNHFLPYLKYFIFGPDLPKSVIAEFSTAREECGEYVTSGDIPMLTALARRLYRRTSLAKKDAAEEFFKLGTECGLSASRAMAIRTTIMQTK